MTENEAIELIENDLKLHSKDLSSKYKNGLRMAINALEKQIPKKPNKAIDSSWGIEKEVHICPECDCFLTEVHFYTEPKTEPNKQITYCDNCGQSIDWSE